MKNMKSQLSSKKATTRGYNDCKKGITTCPFKQEELQIFWSRGFDQAWDEFTYKCIAPTSTHLRSFVKSDLITTETYNKLSLHEKVAFVKLENK